MKGGFLVVQQVNDYLIDKGIKNLIDGDFYMYSRLNNSKKTDIVLGLLSLTAAQVQSGILNLNIHAPNLSLPIGQNGEQDNSQPDIIKLMSISETILPWLKDERVGDYWISVLDPAIPYQDTDGSWFANIRINFNSINKNFK